MEGRTSRTDYQLTRAGRQALAQYVEQLDRLLSSVRDLPPV